MEAYNGMVIAANYTITRCELKMSSDQVLLSTFDQAESCVKNATEKIKSCVVTLRKTNQVGGKEAGNNARFIELRDKAYADITTYLDSVYPKTFKLFMEVKNLLEELTDMDLGDVKEYASRISQDCLAKSKLAMKYQVEHTNVSMRFQNLNEEIAIIVHTLRN